MLSIYVESYITYRSQIQFFCWTKPVLEKPVLQIKGEIFGSRLGKPFWSKNFVVVVFIFLFCLAL